MKHDYEAALKALLEWRDETACGGDLEFFLDVPGIEAVESALRLAAYCQEHKDVMGWQSIETAPKDGTKVLVASDDLSILRRAFWSLTSWVTDANQIIVKPHKLAFWVYLPDDNPFLKTLKQMIEGE